MGHLDFMLKFFTKLTLATLAMMIPMNAHAQDAVVVDPENKVVKTDYIRVTEDEKNVWLQTSVTRYVKDAVSVDLIGAVHIADKQYFIDLNTLFTKSEVLLFEMVGGDKMDKGKKINEAEQKDLQFSLLGAMHNTMQDKLDLAGQKDHVDYSQENFVHADLSMEEFKKLQKEKQESILSFALKNAQNQAKVAGKPVKQPSMIKLLKALVTGNADLLKLNIVHTLGQGDDQIAAFAGKSVIIGDRNEKCLQVMNDQIAAGKKNIGIFYGAAHFPDMEDRMFKMGFKKTNQFWMTAWDIDKEKANR
jgi:hypothetical protein|tara:strand:+ start:18555 stop:19466 length:912 start_codon:yes stop_codon:yes gene_type:complete